MIKWGFPILMLTRTDVAIGFGINLNKSDRFSLKQAFALYGKRKGRLYKNIDVNNDNDTTGEKTNKIPRGKSKMSKSKAKLVNSSKGDKKIISPMLSQWAVQEELVLEDNSPTITKDNPKEEESSTQSSSNIPLTFESFSKEKNSMPKMNSSSRRSKQLVRKEENFKRNQIEKYLIENLQTLLEEKQVDINNFLSVIDDLTKNGPKDATMRTISSSKLEQAYKILWAGSDAAVCFLGTGLHNVPLAKLDELFMLFVKSNVEILEVIRLIGPFPNVRNTLKGSVNIISSNKISITYDSMIDGTGKEILAGTKDNRKKLNNIETLLATDNIIIWKVPLEKESIEQGEDLLVFIREEDLDSQLYKLRVN